MKTKPNKSKQIGEIGVDAGLCWIGDPCYVLHASPMPKAIGKDWDEFCDILDQGAQHPTCKQFCYDMGHPGLGVVVSTGYGDGVYPVVAEFTDDGRIARVSVEFIDQTDEIGRPEKAARKPRIRGKSSPDAPFTHTPGPWDYDMDYIVAPDSDRRFPDIYIAEIAHADDEGRIASPRQQDANRRLIAAAPELREALDYLLEQTVDMDLKYGIGLSEGEADAREKALAAIAKATMQGCDWR